MLPKEDGARQSNESEQPNWGAAILLTWLVTYKRQIYGHRFKWFKRQKRREKDSIGKNKMIPQKIHTHTQVSTLAEALEKQNARLPRGGGRKEERERR